MSESQRQNLVSKILRSGRQHVHRVLSRAAGVDPVARRNLGLRDLEPRLLYSATPVPVPSDGALEAIAVLEAPGEAASTSDARKVELVIVDDSIDDYEQLIDGLVAESGTQIEILVLESDRDGIEQITDFVESRSPFDALHIVSHARDGGVKLGSTWLTTDSLAAYSGMFGTWEKALSEDADILFYGCNLAASQDGQALVESLSILTGADVAASDDLTGHADVGGDWELEVGIGKVEARVVFSEVAQAEWLGTLPVPVLQVITVTTTADENDGVTDSVADLQATPGGTGVSLREAIQATNNTPNSAIEFSIAAPGPHVITVLSQLPLISESVTIDGTTQGDWVVIDGNSLAVPGLQIGSDADDSLIEGLIIRDFASSAIRIDIDSEDNTIRGNRLGSFDDTGLATTGEANDTGVFVHGSNNVIGGTLAAHRNVLSGNVSAGIRLAGVSDDNVIEGNYIGTDQSGIGAHGNGVGVHLLNSASRNLIQANVISGNPGSGVVLSDFVDENEIRGNLIGAAADGSALGNLADGISFQNQARDNFVGGSIGTANTIAFNGVAGISAGSNTLDNEFRFNQIYSNSGLGLDLDDDGVIEPPDALDGDVGANGLQNSPTLTTGIVSGTDLDITGQIQSTPNTDFDIDFYSSLIADPTGYGEAERFLGSISVTTDAGGTATFSQLLTSVGVSLGEAITSTATDSDGNTSEFSQNVVASTPGANTAPRHVLPAVGRTSVDRPLVFSRAWGNPIRVADADAGVGQLRLNLTAERGTITLATTADLSFATGDGVNDSNIVVFGTLASLNDALDGLRFTPDINFGGTARITIETDDQGNSGSGAALTATDSVPIYVGGEVESGLEFIVNKSVAGNQTTTSEDTGSKNAVTILPDGSYVVVWTDSETDGNTTDGVYARVFNADGSLKVDEFRVTDVIGTEQRWASVDSDSTGRFVVTWTGEDSSGTGVFMRRYAADGTEIDTSEVRVNGYTNGAQEDSHVAVNADGLGVIVWEGEDATESTGVFAREFSMDTGLVGGQFRVNSTAAGTQHNARVSINDSGAYVATWQTDDSEIHYRRYSAGGVAGSEILAVSDITIDSPTIALANDGSFTLGYVDENLVDTVEFFAVSGGDTFGATSVIAGLASYNSIGITTDGEGQYFLTYRSRFISTYNIEGLAFRVDGTTIIPTSNVAILDTSGGIADHPSVDMTDPGNMVVVWQNSVNDGDGTAVMAKSFGTSQTGAVLFTAENAGSAGGVSFGTGSLLALSGESLTLETPSTTGELSELIDIADFFTPDPKLAGLHVVSRDILVGSDDAQRQLRKGDVLFSVNQDAVLDGTSLTLHPNDVMLARPVPGTSDLLVSILFDDISDAALPGVELHAFTLVEKDTLIGDTIVQAGNLLFVPDKITGLKQDIYVWHTDGVNEGTTSGSAQLLINGLDVGIDEHIHALDLVESALDVGDRVIEAGSLVISTNNPVTGVGDTPISAGDEDLFVLVPDFTTAGAGTTSGATYLLLDGSDIGLDADTEAINAVVLTGRHLNTAPVMTTGAPSLGVTDEDTTSNAILVSSLLGARVTDVDLEASGVAITDVTGNSQWEYSLDGLLWQTIGSVTDSSALLLSPNAFIRYVPDTLNGETPGISYRAWDQSSGQSGSLTDTSTNGGRTAFSTATDVGLLTVTDINDAPTVVLQNTVPSLAENTSTASSIRVADIVVSDDSIGSNVLSLTGTDAVFFEIQGAELHLKSGTVLDFESQSSYDVTVVVTDSGIPAFDSASHTLAVINLNEAPTVVLQNTVPSLAENTSTASSIRVADIVVSDDSIGSNVLSLTGTDAVFFEIQGTELHLKSGTVLDFESQSSYDVNVVVTDSGIPASDSASHTLVITDLNDVSPIVTAGQGFLLSEIAGVGDSVGFVLATDDDTIGTLWNWTIESGDTGGVFQIDSATGEITVADASNLDYESTSSYTLKVTVHDGVQRSAEENVVVTVLDTDDTPPVIDPGQTFVVSEGAAVNFGLGTATATDPDTAAPVQDWTIVSGNADGVFAIDAVTGNITVADTTNLDYESTQGYVLRLTASDGTNVSLPTDVTINVTDLNDTTPVITANQTFSVLENSPAGSTVGLVAATDPDTVGSLQNWRITGGNVVGIFEIDASTGQITIADPALLDYEYDDEHTLNVRVSDGVGDSAIVSVVIDVINVNSENSIRGAVWEDLGADGASGLKSRISGARVDLYRDTGDGIANAADILVRSTTTTTKYSFTGLEEATYFVVVDSKTLAPSADASPAGDVWAEQTWGAKGTLIGATPTTETGFAFGGRFAGRSDDATTLQTAEHVIQVELSESETGVHFGFSFDVVTNVLGGDTRDDDGGSSRSVQGSLRQFIDNANAISGANSMRFVPAGAPNAGDTWRLNVTHALPAIIDSDTTIDGTAWDSGNPDDTLNPNSQQLGRQRDVGLGLDGVAGTNDDAAIDGVGAPELEIVNDRSTNVVDVGLDLAADGSTVRHLAITGFGTLGDNLSGNLRVGSLATDAYTGVVIEQNVLGSLADTFTRPDANELTGGSNIVVRGADAGIIRNNLIGFAGAWGVRLTDGADNWEISGSEFVRNSRVATNLDAIDVQLGSGDAIIVGNYIRNTGGIAIDTYGSDGGNTIADNMILNSGRKNVEVAGIRLFGASNLVLHNVITGNAAPDGTGGVGVLVVGAHGSFGPGNENVISRNSFGDNGGPSIDLVDAGGSLIDNRRGDGLSTTPGYDKLAGNDGVDAPIIDSAILEGGLVEVTGTAVPSSSVEIYTAAADGDGRRYLGEAAVDAAGKFAFSFAAESDAAIITALTIDPDNQTSEFGVMVPVNSRPIIVSGTRFSVLENGIFVGKLEATDSDSPVQPLTWQIVGGEDAASFALTPTGNLSFVGAPDYELPADVDGNNIYRVRVRVADSLGGTDVRTLEVQVEPVNDNIPFIHTPGTASVAESQVFVMDVGATDGDSPAQSIGYSISGGADRTLFVINENTGRLSFVSPRDFESSSDSDEDNVYEVTVTADDNDGEQATQAIRVTVDDENDTAPVVADGQTFDLPEDSPAGTSLGFIAASDIDTVGGISEYRIENDFDGMFAVSLTTGELTLLDNSNLDKETVPTYVLPVSVSDGVNTTTTELKVVVTNVNESPNSIGLTNTSVPEGINGAVVGEVVFLDPDVGDSHTLTVDDARFEVVGESLKLRAGQALDHETDSTTVVTITVSDAGGLSDSKAFTLHTEDINEQPGAISLTNRSVSENVNGAMIGAVSVTDPDENDTHTFSVSDNRFEVVAGELRLKSNESLDFEQESVVDVTITATDSGGLHSTADFQIVVTDQVLQGTDQSRIADEDAPPIRWNLNDVFSSQLTSSLSFTASGSHLGDVTIDSRGVLSLRLAQDVNGRDTITVTATADGETAVARLHIDITPVNDAPRQVASGIFVVAFESPLQLDPLGVVGDVDNPLSDLTVVTDGLGEAAHGTVTLNENGKLVYTPNAGVTGEDTFTYVVSDGALSVPIHVTMKIGGVVNPGGTSDDQSGAVPDTGSSGVDGGLDDGVNSGEEAPETAVPDPANGETALATPRGEGESTVVESTDEDRSIFDPLLAIETPIDDEQTSVGAFIPFVAVTEADTSRTDSRTDLSSFGTDTQAEAGSGIQQIATERIVGHSRVISREMTDNIELALNELSKDLAHPRIDQVVLGTASLSLGGFSVGYVLWLLRGGSLVASMLTSIPAWRMVDPLPILDFLDSGEDDHDSLDALISRNQKLVSDNVASPSVERK